MRSAHDDTVYVIMNLRAVLNVRAPDVPRSLADVSRAGLLVDCMCPSNVILVLSV